MIFFGCVCGGELELRKNLTDYNAESRLEDSSSEFALKDKLYYDSGVI